jgi:hypothetical protein
VVAAGSGAARGLFRRRALPSDDARVPGALDLAQPWWWEGTMSETTYQGSCHCGNVRYEADLDLSKGGMACNCSMCGRKGTILTFVGEGAFRLKAGADAMTDYKFNRNVINHHFCSSCGVTSFAEGSKDGKPMFAINIRCLEGVELDKLPVKQFDGKSV